jgi:hypothetical protein
MNVVSRFGFVSPFTGLGISFDVQSGALPWAIIWRAFCPLHHHNQRFTSTEALAAISDLPAWVRQHAPGGSVEQDLFASALRERGK